MKEGWEYSNIGDLCDKINGLWKGKTGPFVNVGVIRNANFTKSFTLSFDNIEYLDVEAKQYKTRKLQKGDLIVEKSGGSEKQPVGRTVLFDREEGEYSFSNFTSVLRIKNRDIISPEFLYKYILFVYLRGDTRKMQKATTGIHNIEFDKFLSIPVPKIPLSEQQSIVDYLDSAFAKIDAMKANAEKALNEAKAFFQASLKEMLEPKEGWMEKKVKDLSLLITKGSSPKWQGNSYVNSEGILFVTSENVREGCLEFNPAKFVDNSFNIKQRRSILKKFDVLVNIVGASIGRAAIFDLDVENANINQAVCLIRLNLDKILPSYLCFFLNSDYAFKQYASMVKEAARANLSLENIGSLEIGIPSLSEQQSIVETLDSLKSKVDRLQENYNKISQECDALKQAILRQVFE